MNTTKLLTLILHIFMFISAASADDELNSTHIEFENIVDPTSSAEQMTISNSKNTALTLQGIVCSVELCHCVINGAVFSEEDKINNLFIRSIRKNQVILMDEHDKTTVLLIK